MDAKIENSTPLAPVPIDSNNPPPPPYSTIAGFQFDNSHPIQSTIPDYFSIEGVPKANVLLPAQVAGLNLGRSDAQVTRSGGPMGSVECFDPKLESSIDELMKYFLTYSTPPQFFVEMKGTHQERRTRTVHRDGKTHIEHYTETVTDFDIKVDMVRYVPGMLHDILLL